MPPNKVQVTLHAVGRWAERVLGVGQVDEELRQQAQRAWDEGRQIGGSRSDRQYRLWRELTWVFLVNEHTAVLMTVHQPDEPESEAETHGRQGSEVGPGVVG